MRAVEYTDCAIKFEILLASFHSWLRFSSFFEMFVLILMCGFFIRSPSRMWFYLFHMLHLGRGFIGLYISSKVPLPQDFSSKLREDAVKNPVG